MKLAIEKIRTDGGTQVRETLDQKTVDRYAELYAAGEKLPPLDVFFDGVDYWMAEGFHRHAGLEKNEATTAEIELHEGTKEDALWFATTANLKHGLPLKASDRRRAAEVVLLHPKGQGLSNREVARRVGCSDKTVASVREKLESGAEIPHLDKRVGADGKEYPAKQDRPSGSDTEPEAIKAGPSDEPLDPADDFQLDLNLDSMGPVEVAAPWNDDADAVDRLGPDQEEEGPLDEPTKRFRLENLGRSLDALVTRWPDDVEICELTRLLQNALIKLKNRFSDSVNRGHVKKVADEVQNMFLCDLYTEGKNHGK